MPVINLNVIVILIVVFVGLIVWQVYYCILWDNKLCREIL